MEEFLNKQKPIKKERVSSIFEKKSKIKVDKDIGKNIQNKYISIMKRRYELAYHKLFNELPVWKQNSFKNNNNRRDTLYDEFIRSVIQLAENETNSIFLTT